VTAPREHLNLFALALHRATVLRFGAAPQGDEEAVRASDAHLPGAGWVVGIAACIVFALVAVALRATPWSALVAGVAATIATAALTRGRAETALFRTWERFETGAGSLVLPLALVAKLALLAAMASRSEPAVIGVLFAAQVVPRLAPLLLARSLAAGVPARAVHVGALWCVIPLAGVLVAAGIAATVLAVAAFALASYGLWRLAHRQADPADRDRLASAQQVCEVAFLFGAALGL
jgi:adenosylcobinamide-GDP ribazoletransferase